MGSNGGESDTMKRGNHLWRCYVLPNIPQGDEQQIKFDFDDRSGKRSARATRIDTFITSKLTI